MPKKGQVYCKYSWPLNNVGVRGTDSQPPYVFAITFDSPQILLLTVYY